MNMQWGNQGTIQNFKKNALDRQSSTGRTSKQTNACTKNNQQDSEENRELKQLPKKKVNLQFRRVYRLQNTADFLPSLGHSETQSRTKITFETKTINQT